MSVEIKYKGNTIASANTDITKTLKTSGKYCEGDIEIVNTQDGGITPTGNINITDTNVTDVTNYATAQVVDADLIASNIKKDVNILGVVGSFEGGGGGVPARTKWWRSPDMPQYENISIATSGGSDVYYTFDMGASPNLQSFTCVARNENTCVCEIGYYDFDTSSFVALSSTNVPYNGSAVITIPSGNRQFLVIHVYSAVIYGIKHYFEAETQIPIIEVYGRFGVNQHDEILTNTYITTAATLSGTGAVLSIENFTKLPKYAKRIDLSSATIPDYSYYSTITGFMATEFILPSSGYTSTGAGRYIGISACYNGFPNVREFDLSMINLGTNTALWSTLYNNASLETVNIGNWNMSAVTDTVNFLRSNPKLKNIITNASTVFPSVDFGINESSLLTDTSLVNIANALPTASATITLHATPKARLSTIMGTVADGVFTADESGDITLLSFINNTKGWTVA